MIRLKSVAVASGKGGVGKSTTSVNLAVYAARRGLRTALVDLDPLSDIGTILDIDDAVAAADGKNLSGLDLDDVAHPVCPGLDLLFPKSKLRPEDRAALRELIFDRFSSELDRRYDLLIFDLPAGSDEEENLGFLPHIGQLIVVTNAEPTAHVAAGGYIREVFLRDQDRTAWILHNKYAPLQQESDGGFDPRRVAETYNRNVPEDLRLSDADRGRIRDLGFVPRDASLDLLQSSPSIMMHVQRNMMEFLELLYQERLSQFSALLPMKGKLPSLIEGYLRRQRSVGDAEEYLSGLGSYLGGLLRSRVLSLSTEQKRPDSAGEAEIGREFFTTEERKRLLRYLQSVKADRLLRMIRKTERFLSALLADQERTARLFYTGVESGDTASYDRELVRLLTVVNGIARDRGDFRNAGGLLLFYFSLYKLFSSRNVVRLIAGLIPVRRDGKGRTVRDRRRQIGLMLEESLEYRESYNRLLRTVYPIAIRQVTNMVNTLRLRNLILLDDTGEIHKKAYLQLLSGFIHDTVNSGLSIVVDFEYRPAAIAFRRAADELLNGMREGASVEAGAGAPA